MRVAFTTMFQECFGRQARIHYPHALQKVPNFAEWLEQEVGAAKNTIEKPTHDKFKESRLPEKIAISYRAMYVHGMHLRIQSAEEEKITSNSRVAAAMLRRHKGQSGDTSGEVQKAKYVGWIEEILELDYQNHYYVVLVCSWIPRNLTTPNPKVIYDDYGFMLGNFRDTMPLGPDSFAFPTQCI